jgi:peptidoglycan hydrolase CwlO-like protein
MDKKAQKKIDTLQKRIQNLKQQIAGAKKQMDDPAELKALEKHFADAEAELRKLRGE